MLSVKQVPFLSITRAGIEPRSYGPLENTLLIRPMARSYFPNSEEEMDSCFSQVYYAGKYSRPHIKFELGSPGPFSTKITIHHVVPLAQISLTLSRQISLSFIASGRSSGLHPVSLYSCCMYVLARPYVGVHRSKSLMSSSLLLQQCSACLVRLTWIVFGMGGRLPYSWCFVGCCRQDLFNIARNILV